MKKTILTVGIAMLFIVGSATFIGCGNAENQETDVHEHAEGDEHNHENMDMSNESTYSCPMHPEITGNEGDKCSECGMDLVQ